MNGLRSIPARHLHILNKIFEYYYFGNVKFWQQKIQGTFRKLKEIYNVTEGRTHNLVLQGSKRYHFGTGVLFCRIPKVKFRYM